jgi:hypothetical protein
MGLHGYPELGGVRSGDPQPEEVSIVVLIMDKLFKDLEKDVEESGVDLFGVADLTPLDVNNFVLKQGGEHIADYPQAISLGIKLVDGVVDELYRHEEPSAIYTYRGLYDSVNNNLDRAALKIAKTIQEHGYKGYPIPASQTVDERRLEAAFSIRLQPITLD